MSQDIYEGSLTKYLLYPTDYFGFKYAAHLGDLVPGVIQLALFGLLSFLFLDLPELTVTPASLAMTLVLVALANLLGS